jgi:hypothetical protein
MKSLPVKLPEGCHAAETGEWNKYLLYCTGSEKFLSG